MKITGTAMTFECSGRQIDLKTRIANVAFGPLGDGLGHRIAIGEVHEVFPAWKDKLTSEECAEFGQYMAKMWTEWAKP